MAAHANTSVCISPGSILPVGACAWSNTYYAWRFS